MIIEKQKRYRCTRVLNFMVKNGNTYHTTRLGGIYNGIIILDCIPDQYHGYFVEFDKVDPSYEIQYFEDQN